MSRRPKVLQPSHVRREWGWRGGDNALPADSTNPAHTLIARPRNQSPRLGMVLPIASATVLLLAAALGAGQLLGRIRSQGPTAAANPTSVEPRHSSGLVLLGPLDRDAIHPLPEPLAGALSEAQELARNNPHLFGYPYADRKTGELVLSPANAAGEALAQRWTPKDAEALAVPRRVRVVDRSYARLEAIRHEAIGPGAADLPDADAIQATAQDDEHNRVLIIITRMSDPLLFALAARYGTEAIAMRLDPNFGPFVSLGGNRDATLSAFAILGAAVLLAFAAVAVALMRRRARV